ncbi:MAG: C_GCAxxG_C_C family protein [Candidatus Thermoplasmatota archaeon]|nr:C_GCAxxG_C_C family protein [Candidatus Thermoplasmatota archaeon]
MTADAQTDRAAELARKYEHTIGSCPQCVLAALHETLGIASPDIIQASDGLAGGTALSVSGTCGALVGGVLAIGSVVGRSYEDFKAGKGERRVFVHSQRLYRRFTQKYGSSVCCDVQEQVLGRSYDLLDAEEAAAFSEQASRDTCPQVAADVTRWTAEIIIGLQARQNG